MAKQAWIWLGVLLWGMVTAAAAQQPTISRDYAILPNIKTVLSADETLVTVEFTVRNSGADATAPTTLRVINLLDNSTVHDGTFAPLRTGEARTVTLPLPTAKFPAGANVPLRIEVGIDDLEPANSVIALDNAFQFSVEIPLTAGAAPTPAPIVADAPPAQASDAPLFAVDESGVTLFGQFFPTEQVLIGVGVLAGALLLLWLFSVMIRLIFGTPPIFDLWQPPYAQMPPLDPNSLEGRRQAWQQHAQSPLILGAPQPNAVYAVKTLLNMEGAPLENWRVVGLRAMQYDNYGRVAQSQHIASNSLLKRMNALLKRRAKLKPEQLERQLRGIVQRFIKDFRKRITKQNAFLPIALDLRLDGKHGEVRILFELYQFQNGRWVRIDQWEPVMAILTRMIEEQFTYTVHGIRGGERLRDYHRRLVQDITWLLLETLRVRTPSSKPASVPQVDTPDTVTGMKPIGSAAQES